MTRLLTGALAAITPFVFAIIAPTHVSAQAIESSLLESYAVLAGSAVTNTGSSVIDGNIGVSPGSAISGFPPGVVIAPGTISSNDANDIQAQIDLINAFNTLSDAPTTISLTGKDLGGLVLNPLKSRPEERGKFPTLGTGSQAYLAKGDVWVAGPGTYWSGRNSYMRKPVGFDQFIEIARLVGLYWPLLNEPPEPGRLPGGTHG